MISRVLRAAERTSFGSASWVDNAVAASVAESGSLLSCPPLKCKPTPKGTTSRSSSSRTSAGLAGLATLRDLPLAAQVRAALGRYLEVALPNHRSDEGDAWTFLWGAAINEGHQVPAPSLHSERLEHGSACCSLRPDHRRRTLAGSWSYSQRGRRTLCEKLLRKPRGVCRALRDCRRWRPGDSL